MKKILAESVFLEKERKYPIPGMRVIRPECMGDIGADQKNISFLKLIHHFSNRAGTFPFHDQAELVLRVIMQIVKMIILVPVVHLE